MLYPLFRILFDESLCLRLTHSLRLLEVFQSFVFHALHTLRHTKEEITVAEVGIDLDTLLSRRHRIVGKPHAQL